MKINICQSNYFCRDCERNLQMMVSTMDNTGQDTLNVFSELSLCGSPLYDSNVYEEIYKQTTAAGNRLCNTGKSFIVGTPLKDNGFRYNSLVFVAKGQVLALSTKRNLGRFDNNFAPGNGLEIVEYQGQRLAFGFVEDLENFIGRGIGCELIVLCSNVLFDKDNNDETIKTLCFYAKQLKAKIVFVNRVGAEGSFVFGGGSCAIDKNGEIAEILPFFEQKTTLADTDNLGRVPVETRIYEKDIHDACVSGLRDYFTKNNITKAVIGLSGGIDSALALVLAVRALGKENVTGVLMPSKFSSDHSISDAEKSAKNLGIEYYTLAIEDIFEASLKTMEPVFKNTEPNTAEENLQARARCMIVMAICNKIGAAMINTSNKSESAVGYGTLYGDDSGAIAVIGDLYKTEVYKLARWINKDEEIIPKNSIDKAPSAELHYDQKDSDTLPEYDLLDKILSDRIEGKMSQDELVAKGYNEVVVRRVLHLININEWKRHQEAPALRLGKTCFTTDYKQPIS